MAHRKMEQIAEEKGKPIRQILQEEFEKHGSQVAVAKELGINQSTLSYWLLKLNLEQRSVLVEREKA
jgi:transposase-like protein